MRPPVEIADRSQYTRRAKELLVLDPRRTVVLTIDMQRDYLDLEVASAPVAADEAERVLSHSRELLDFARSRSIPVIHVYVVHRQIELDHGVTGPIGRLTAATGLSQNAQAGPRRIPNRLAGSPQAEIPRALVGPEDIHVTSKKTNDGFLGTELEILLARVYRPEVVVLTGINTDTCVYSTTMSTGNRGYLPVVISDCTASMRGKDHHWMALELMSRSIACVLTVDEFKAKVSQAAGAGRELTAIGSSA
jgi:biuret amidohydrolase